MSLKKNDSVIITIEDITNLGFGVGRHDGAVIFVQDAVIGDKVTCKIIKAAKNYYVGKATEYITLSPLRDQSRCDNKKCRACAYKLIGYKDELKLKENLIRSEFIKNGLADISVMKTVPSPKLSGYRNKAQYPISIDKDGNYVIGFYSPKTHNVAEASKCILCPPVFGEVLETLRDFFAKYKLSVYSEETGIGLLRHVYMRRSEESKDVLLTLVLNGTTTGHDEELIDTVRRAHPEVCGIMINENRENTNVILGNKFINIFGKDYITDTLAGAKLKITAPSFYQVNHGTAELIYKHARRLADLKKSDTLLDLFCGCGSIGLSMAEDCGELIGIEIIDAAVACAKENAVACGIKNAHFYTGDASASKELLDVAERSMGRKISPDVIILDPPRGGCSEELLEYISTLGAKRIVYISCNPATLARDVKLLTNMGFSADTVYGYDMFPMTGHVESVVRLERRLDVDMRR